jgi:RNA polymerase subunit RPABC4/transcription elongation factor Spt4
MRNDRRRLVEALALLPLASLAATELPRIRMFELYKDDKSYSDTAKKLAGKTISMQGFMAPHLKVESDFFVLSNSPAETCPFCASEDEWIDTIIFVRMKKRQEATRPGNLIQVEGKLEIGPQTDASTGFVSRVRLVDANFRLL